MENRFEYEKTATTTYENLYTPENSQEDIAKFYALIGKENAQNLNQQIGQMAATAYNDPFAQTEKMVNTQTGVSDKREKQLNYYGYSVDDYQEQKGVPGEQYRKAPVKSFLNLDPNAGPVQNVFDLLCRPLYMVTGSLENLSDEDSSTTFVMGMKDGLMGTDKVQGVDLVMSVTNQTYDELSLAGKAAGLAIDVFADPLFYVSPISTVTSAVGDFAKYAGKYAPAPVKNLGESIKYGFLGAFSTDKNTANGIEKAVNVEKQAWGHEVSIMFENLNPAIKLQDSLKNSYKSNLEFAKILDDYYPVDPTGVNNSLDFFLADMFQATYTGEFNIGTDEINDLFLNEGKTSIDIISTDSLDDIQSKLDQFTIHRYSRNRKIDTESGFENKFTVFESKAKSNRGAKVFTIRRGENVKLQDRKILSFKHSNIRDEKGKFTGGLEGLNKLERSNIPENVENLVRITRDAQEQFILKANHLNPDFTVQDMFAGKFSDTYLPTLFFDSTFSQTKKRSKIDTARLKGGNAGFTAGKKVFGNLTDIMDPDLLPSARRDEIIDGLTKNITMKRQELESLGKSTYNMVDDLDLPPELKTQIKTSYKKLVDTLKYNESKKRMKDQPGMMFPKWEDLGDETFRDIDGEPMLEQLPSKQEIAKDVMQTTPTGETKKVGEFKEKTRRGMFEGALRPGKTIDKVKFMKGNPALLRAPRIVAGIGSRKLTPDQRTKYLEWIKNEVAAGSTFITGGAVGADAMIMQNVPANRLIISLPSLNSELDPHGAYQKFVDEGSLLLSHTDKEDIENKDFLRRNKIIVDLADIVNYIGPLKKSTTYTELASKGDVSPLSTDDMDKIDDLESQADSLIDRADGLRAEASIIKTELDTMLDKLSAEGDKIFEPDYVPGKGMPSFQEAVKLQDNIDALMFEVAKLEDQAMDLLNDAEKVVKPVVDDIKKDVKDDIDMSIKSRYINWEKLKASDPKVEKAAARWFNNYETLQKYYDDLENLYNERDLTKDQPYAFGLLEGAGSYTHRSLRVREKARYEDMVSKMELEGEGTQKFGSDELERNIVRRNQRRQGMAHFRESRTTEEKSFGARKSEASAAKGTTFRKQMQLENYDEIAINQINQRIAVQEEKIAALEKMTSKSEKMAIDKYGKANIITPKDLAKMTPEELDEMQKSLALEEFLKIPVEKTKEIKTGTGAAVSYARKQGVPVFDIGVKDPTLYKFNLWNDAINEVAQPLADEFNASGNEGVGYMFFSEIFGARNAGRLMNGTGVQVSSIPEINHVMDNLEKVGAINPLTNSEMTKNLAKDGLLQNMDQLQVLQTAPQVLKHQFIRMNNIGNEIDYFFDNNGEFTDTTGVNKMTPTEVSQFFDQRIGEMAGIIESVDGLMNDISTLNQTTLEKLAPSDGGKNKILSDAEFDQLHTIVTRFSRMVDTFKQTASGSAIPNKFNDINTFQKNVDEGLRGRVGKQHKAFPEYSKLRKSVNDLSNTLSAVQEMSDDFSTSALRIMSGKNSKAAGKILTKITDPEDVAFGSVKNIIDKSVDFSTEDIGSSLLHLNPSIAEGVIGNIYAVMGNGYWDLINSQKDIVKNYIKHGRTVETKRDQGPPAMINLAKHIETLETNSAAIEMFLESSIDNHGIVNPLVALEYKYQHIPNQAGAISTIGEFVNMVNNPKTSEVRLIHPGEKRVDGVRVSMEEFFRGIGGTSTPATVRQLEKIKGLDMANWEKYALDIHPDLHKMFQRSQNTQSVNKVIEWFDNATSIVKGGLLLSLSYHWGNLTGNMFNAHMAGINPAEMLTYTQRAKRYSQMYDNIVRGTLNPDTDITPADREILNLFTPFFDSGLGATKGATKGDRLMNDYLKLNKNSNALMKLYNANFNLSARPELWQRFGVFMWAMDPKNAGKMPSWVIGDAKDVKVRYSQADDSRVGKSVNGKEIEISDSYKRRVQQAIKFTEGSLFNYNDLTHFESKYIKRIIPFYTFMKKNAIFSANVLMNDPRKITGMYKFNNAWMTNFQEATGTTEDQIPDYAFDAGYIPSILLSQNETISMFKLSNPTYAGMETLLSPFSAMKQGLNPLIKTPIEMMTNTQLYNGMPMYDTTSDTANFDYVKTVMSSLGFKWAFNLSESIQAVFQTMYTGTVPSLAASGTNDNILPSVVKSSTKSSVELNQLISENAKYSAIFEKYGYDKELDPIAAQVAQDIITRDNPADTANLIKMYMLM